MKKIGLFTILIAILFLTGCGNTTKLQRLTCNQKIKTVSVDMIADFKDDKITYFGLEYDMDLSGISDKEINLVNQVDMCETVKKSVSQYTDAFKNCKKTKEDKILKITADFDLNKIINNESKEEITLEAFKDKLEKENYLCVIEDK